MQCSKREAPTGMSVAEKLNRTKTMKTIVSLAGGGAIRRASGRVAWRYVWCVLGLFLIAGSNALAQSTLNWTQATPGSPSPSARSGHAMVFDAARQKVIVFGGLDATGNFLNDMWQWDLATQSWSLVPPATSSVPRPRANFALAYDVNRSKIVLYGGNVPVDTNNNVGIVGDTWEFDSATLTWTQIPASTLFYVGLWGAQAAYDPNLRQVILFGGQPYWGIPENGNTYAWSGTGWTVVASTPAPSYSYNNGYVCTSDWGPGPDGRVRHMMATDTKRSRVVLFGGHTSSCSNVTLGDTWEWDGTSWTQVAISRHAPAARAGSGFAYDSALGLSLLFGGWSDSSGFFGDTWEWDGTNWTPQQPNTSPTIRWTNMAYDAVNPNVVMFGGDATSGPSLYSGYRPGGGPSALGESWFVSTPATTATLLTSSENPAGAGDSVTLTATVTSSSVTPTGSVTFSNGSTTLSTVPLGSSGFLGGNGSAPPASRVSGSAILTIEDSDSLGAGSFTITAQYIPDTSAFTPSSARITQTVAMPGVALTNGNNTLTGNQTVNGLLSATSFVGDGSALTGVTATNAMALAGITAFNYARLDIDNLFSGNQTIAGTMLARSFVGDGSGLTGVTSTATTANFATNASQLGGVGAGSYSRLDIANAFTGTQSISSGNLALPNTNGAGTAGVITLGGNPFLSNFGGNTFVGQAGNFTTASGGGNTASGTAALSSNTSGALNTASGTASLNSNTSGSTNTATGVSALQFNTTGNGNTATGTSALESNLAGSNNTASGTSALFFNTTGSANTALGWQAGFNHNGPTGNTTGSNNTFIGSNSGSGTSTQLTNATAIGANAAVSANNALVLGSINGVNGATASVNVGIGTATPAQALDVVGNVKLEGSGNGVMFPDGTTQTTAASGGNITGVTAGSGITGGGTSGNVSLSVDGTVARTNTSNAFTGNQTVGGTVSATGFSGDGSGLTALNAANIHGVIADANLSSNVPFLNKGNSFVAGQQFTTLAASANSGSPVISSISFGPGPAVAGTSENSQYGVGTVGTSSGLNGTGVEGMATGGSGAGVIGIASNGGASLAWRTAGVRGITAVAGTGGVLGESQLTGSTAGIFDNQAGGKILSGQNSGVEKFSVDGKGDVATSGSVTIGTGGTPITEHLSMLFANVAFNTKMPPATCTVWSPVIASAADGDTIAVGMSSSLMSANILFSAWASNGSVSVRICNPTGSPTTVGSGNVRIDVWKH
jgi:hypothetical protein